MNHLISSFFYYKIKPMGKPRQVASDRWKKRPEVLRYRAYADELRYAARQQKFFLGDRCIMVFEIPMAPSWSNKRKALMNGKPHTQKPDWDNISKGCQDILKTDDSSVHTVFCAKFWGYEGSIRLYNLHQTKESTVESLIRSIESDDSYQNQDWF